MKQSETKLKKHENHICRFNDGECICECYSQGFEDAKKQFEKLLEKACDNFLFAPNSLKELLERLRDL